MQQLLQFLFTQICWRYNPHGDWYDQLYHWFNLVEGWAWLIIAALVLVRYARRSKSWLELLYGAAFVSFGLSDFREAYYLTSWLILFRAANLAALLCLRWLVLRRYYPERKSF